MALQLQLRRTAKYEATTWDYDSICSLLTLSHPHDHDHELQLPLPLRPGSQQDQEKAAADDDDAIANANHLQQLAATTTSNTDSSSSISSSSSSEMESVQASLKDSVRRLLLHQKEEEEDDDDYTSRLLRAIHQLQSLGIAYHFHQEIRSILLSMLHQHHDHILDLHSAALLFRMLRGLGIPASTDMLVSALLREEGDKITDTDALLAVHHASYLAFPGETLLDQARAFAVGKLLAARAGRDDHDSDCTQSQSHHLSLSSSLPLHWTAPRLQAMWSLSLTTKDVVVVDPAILQLAQVDFNLVQALHRRELAEVTRWWKESSLGDYSFARDRVVECFFCAACIAPEPRLADSREVLAKTGALIVHLDDIYDVYGTLDELQAFTDAIASWEHCEALPEYMKPIYSAICTTSAAAADRVLEKHGYDMLPLYKKTWHELCKAFLVEAQWQQQGYMPSFGEYVSNGWVTSTGPLLLLHALAAAGIPITQTQTQTTQAHHHNGIVDYPRLVELSSTIFRLCNDCAELQRGDAPSSIACCMAEPWCAGEDQARAAVQGVMAETWKLLNREVAAAAAAAAGGDDPTSCSSADESMTTTMANLCLNLARIIHCIYHDGDGITSPTHRMKQMVKDLLFNPIHHISI